jgi:hypothetical protein
MMNRFALFILEDIYDIQTTVRIPVSSDTRYGRYEEERTTCQATDRSEAIEE